MRKLRIAFLVVCVFGVQDVCFSAEPQPWEVLNGCYRTVLFNGKPPVNSVADYTPDQDAKGNAWGNPTGHQGLGVFGDQNASICDPRGKLLPGVEFLLYIGVHCFEAGGSTRCYDAFLKAYFLEAGEYVADSSGYHYRYSGHVAWAYDNGPGAFRQFIQSIDVRPLDEKKFQIAEHLIVRYDDHAQLDYDIASDLIIERIPCPYLQ